MIIASQGRDCPEQDLARTTQPGMHERRPREGAAASSIPCRVIEPVCVVFPLMKDTYVP